MSGTTEVLLNEDKIYKPSEKTLKNAKIITSTLLIILSISTYLYLVSTQTFNVSYFDISTIYEFREEREISTLFNYFIIWEYRIINPAIIVF